MAHLLHSDQELATRYQRLFLPDMTIMSSDITLLPATLTRPMRKAQCTHTIVAREYSAAACQVCRRVPPTSYLYVCRHDHEQEQVEDKLSNLFGYSTRVPATLEDAIKQARHLQMSDSVIHQMETGVYTIEKAQILIAQRKHVLDVLDDLVIVEESAVDPLSPDSPPYRVDSHSAAMRYGKEDFNEKSQSLESDRERKGITISGMCQLKVCYTCRPFVRERFWSSFETVIGQEEEAFERENFESLPIYNSAVLKTIGDGIYRRHPNTPKSIYTWSGLGSNWPEDNSDESHTPSSITSSDYSDETIEDGDPSSYTGQKGTFVPRNIDNHHQEQLVREYSSLCIQSTTPAKSSSSASQAPTSPTMDNFSTNTPLSLYNLRTSTTPSSSAADTTPLTPFFPHSNEECFEDSFVRMERETSMPSLISSLPHRPKQGTPWPLAKEENDPFNEALGLHIGKEVAVTEEAVEKGIPDVFA